MKKLLLTAAAAIAAVSMHAGEAVPFSVTFDSPESLEGFTLDGSSSLTSFKYLSKESNPVRFQNSIVSKSPYSGNKSTWLISPAISVVKGENYQVTFSYTGTNSYRDKVAVCAGPEGTPSALGNNIIESDIQLWGKGHLDAADVEVLRTTFTASETGDYYIGLMAYGDQGDTAIYDMSVAVAASDDSPGEVTDFTVTPDAKGFLKAVLSCKTPSVTLGGAPLTALAKLEFLRDDVVINTVNNPAPGRTYTYTDNESLNGNHRYGAVATSGEGSGNVVEQTVYVGTYEPNEATDVVATAMADGTVKLTWKAPERAFNTELLDPALLTYRITMYENGEPVKVYDPVSGTETTLTIPGASDSQHYLSFGVRALTTGGEAYTETVSNPVVVGPADGVPYTETFTGGKSDHAMCGVNGTWNGTWNFNASLNDGGVAEFIGGYNYDASLYTGKIALPAQPAQVLSFLYSGFSNSNNGTLTVRIAAEGENYTDLVSVQPATADWNTATADLSAYAGKTIQLCFFAKGGSATLKMLLDNVKIAEVAPVDLAIAPAEFPTSAEYCLNVPATVEVKNLGRDAVASYTVALTRDGLPYRTAASTKALAPGESEIIEFSVYANETDGATHTYQAEVTCEGDGNLANNRTGRLVVTSYVPELEAPTTLRATVEGNDVKLTWATPEGADYDAESPYHHLIGYTVYRDDRMLNIEDIKANEFVDREREPGKYVYTVAAVYTRGTSAKSNQETAEVKESGISTIAIDTLASDAVIYDLGGRRIDTRNITPGIYILVNGTNASRVALR